MIFKFVEKPIVLECFTAMNYVIECAPIHYAIKHAPDWWKKLPVPDKDSTDTSMRNCVGLVEYYRKSIAIPLWCDLKIEVFKDQNFMWQFSDQRTIANQHPRNQMTGFLENGYGHLKINSPWKLKSPKGIYWVWSHPTYNYAHSYDIVSLPGLVEFHYQSAVHINTMIDLRSEKKIFIPQGQPLAMLTPMSDRKIKIVRHLVSEKEIDNMDLLSTPTKFKAKYKNFVKRKEQFADCPYHKEK